MALTPRPRRLPADAGAAVASSMFVLVLMAGLTAGLTALVITDTKVRALDSTRTQAFYVAHAGLEELTSALGNLFDTNYAPSGAQINALTAATPGLGATWLTPGGNPGYTIKFPTDAAGNPLPTVMNVLSGPFQGLVGMATPYTMAVTARLSDGSEASLTRTLQTVAIPVFQFGLFSDSDLSFFAGPNFAFGGRVHTNGNLYLASGDGSTLTLADKVTAVGAVIRTNLSNGWKLTTNYNGTVDPITAPNVFRALAMTEGSQTGTVGTPNNDPTWTNLSTGTYNHNLANGRTGVKALTLPIVSFGATPIDLIRRGLVNENVANPAVYNERYYSFASLRILLSDTQADITNLPGVTPTLPIPLGDSTLAPLIAGYTAGPLAVVPVTSAVATNAGYGGRVPAGTPQLGGFIKIERQDLVGGWHDVTLEILNLGIADKQWGCAGDPNPAAVAGQAILLLERPRDNSGGCLATPVVSKNDFIANALYDPREGTYRDTQPATAPVTIGGVMYYIGLDVNNLRRWFLGQIGATGLNTMNVTGYVVYFSDRRGNANALGQETAEFGFEDIVNPLSAAGTPNGVLDVGEDLNGNGVLDVYGATALAPFPWPFAPAAAPVRMPWATVGLAAPLAAAMTPMTPADVTNTALGAAIARRNPAVFFRRALKLQNGALGNIIAPGLTVVSENPVYVQGNWNANGAGFGNPHVATAVIADAVTLLSSVWDDRNSFTGPDDLTKRVAGNTWYRLAVIAGKGLSFPQPGGTPQDFGTDGGAHNFLRYIENWGGQQLNYRGSIVSMYTSRQAVGTFKCCTDVYSPPTRGYNFDSDFLTPALLPPRTPMFRDVNTTGFAQIIRPQGGG
jgi:hypothetical protein